MEVPFLRAVHDDFFSGPNPRALRRGGLCRRAGGHHLRRPGLHLHFSYYGPQNFLWFCDIGNFVLVVALWKESALLFSWQAVSVL